jgi:iron complex transport system substrate-binding protein
LRQRLPSLSLPEKNYKFIFGYMNRSPQRIVCLSAEAADWLWRIGAWEQVVGVTAFFNLPPEAQKKPKVSGFSSANLPQIQELNPDLIITFSDVQSSLAAESIRRGFPVVATNQRSLAEVEQTLALLGRIVDRNCEPWLREFRDRLQSVEPIEPRPRVYFEEWNDPLVFGISWVNELIERAGGRDVFAGQESRPAASERIVSPEQVCAANPEVIIASWCGKPVQSAEIVARPGFPGMAAVRNGRIYEIPGPDILQPGFRLVYGYEHLKKIILRP